jgi:hypothetical protein
MTISPPESQKARRTILALWLLSRNAADPRPTISSPNAQPRIYLVDGGIEVVRHDGPGHVRRWAGVSLDCVRRCVTRARAASLCYTMHVRRPARVYKLLIMQIPTKLYSLSMCLCGSFSTVSNEFEFFDFTKAVIDSYLKTRDF